MKILHLDPDEYYHQKLREAVSSFADMAVLTQSRGITRELKKHEPHALVMELFLEDRHGYEVLKEIKTQRAYKALPVIIFSRIDNLEDVEQSLTLGAAGYYVKGKNSIQEIKELLLTLS